jgi:hypothetical protein
VVPAALVVMAGERKGNAAFALADLLSRRGLERPCERTPLGTLTQAGPDRSFSSQPSVSSK